MDDEYQGSYSSWRARLPVWWGKRTWEALFLLAADYPHDQDCWDDGEMLDEDVKARKAGWRQLLKSLPFVLTCGVCATHFQKYIEHDNGRRLEQALRDRESLLTFLYNCKKEVNKRNGRGSPSYTQVRRRFVPPCERKPAAKKRSGKRSTRRGA